MTTEDFQQSDMASAIAILPVAAIEQHGPHLPVEVDTAINRGVLARAMELVPPDLPVTVLPAMPIGKSNEHISYPGTLTLSAETLIRLWTEIGESVVRAGVRKLVLFNSHGGQIQTMQIVARELRVRHAMFVVTASTYALAGRPACFRDGTQARHPWRLGRDLDHDVSPSRPGAPRQARQFPPALARHGGRLRDPDPEGSIGFGWKRWISACPGLRRCLRRGCRSRQASGRALRQPLCEAARGNPPLPAQCPAGWAPAQ
jgi:creatinine amidohydrolase